MPYKVLPFIQEMYLQDIRNALYKVLTSDIEKAKILYQYSEKFLMIPDYWLHLITLLEDITTDATTLHSCRILALSHFYSTLYGNNNDKHIEWDGYDGIISKCRTYDTYPHAIQALEEALTFPHHELEMCYNAYETLSAKPISKDLQEKYNQSLKIFDILKTSNFNEQWFKALKCIGNYEIIVINFEYFIGLNYSCKKLWKEYISYMKARNQIALLSIYRRYIRFFIGDLSMINEYRNEIERIGNFEDVSDFWEDTIKFELEICGLKYAQKLFNRAILATLKQDFGGHLFGQKIVQLCRNFNAQRILYFGSFDKKTEYANFTNALQQWKTMASKKFKFISAKKDVVAKVNVVEGVTATVSNLNPTTKFNPLTASTQSYTLPISYIYQILKSATPKILSNLFQSCKSLFKLHSTPLCYQLGVNDEVIPQYFQQSLFIPVSKIAFPGLQKLHIVNSLDWIVETDRKALSKVIPYFYRCDAKFIHIDSQDLSIDEFKFITSNMQILHICNTNIFNSDGTVLSQNEIVALTSGIVRFETIHW